MPSETSPTLAISGAATVNEGIALHVEFVVDWHRRQHDHQWTITWGDGSAAQALPATPRVSRTHIPTAPPRARSVPRPPIRDGTFNAGNTVAVTVNNVAPTLSISGASSVNEGAVYTLNLSRPIRAPTRSPMDDQLGRWLAANRDRQSSQRHAYFRRRHATTISATATDEDGTFNAAIQSRSRSTTSRRRSRSAARRASTKARSTR